MDNDLEARIRTRAYHIWENDPSPDGNAEKHWEEARRQIEAEGGDSQDNAGYDGDQSADRQRGDQVVDEDKLQDVTDLDAESDAKASASAGSK